MCLKQCCKVLMASKEVHQNVEQKKRLADKGKQKKCSAQSFGSCFFPAALFYIIFSQSQIHLMEK